jgi:hypothetical protein
MGEDRRAGGTARPGKTETERGDSACLNRRAGVDGPEKYNRLYNLAGKPGSGRREAGGRIFDIAAEAERRKT